MATPAVTTLGAIRTLAQSMSDMVGESSVTPGEWLSFINLAWFELYDLLIQAYGNDYYAATPALITTDGTNDKFALPADFYKLLGVDLQVNGAAGAAGGFYINLKPFAFAERNKFTAPQMAAYFGRVRPAYRLLGNNLWLKPLPQNGQTIQLWYAPRLTALVADTDTVDGVSGWEIYIATQAAIWAKDKQESDVSVLMAQKQALVQRIQEAAENRDAGGAYRVSDAPVDELDGWNGGGFSGGGFY